MKQYNKYLIRPTDQFNPLNFSSVDDEIEIINEETGKLSSFFKVEIILSFLKDESMENIWVDANPELADLVTSGSLFKGHIKSLFESCGDNPIFRQDLEDYLKERFANGTPQGEPQGNLARK